jgi:hypothetical protein
MIGSLDYPLMTVGELARALGVPREFVYTHMLTNLALFACVSLITTLAIRRSSNAAGRYASHGAHVSRCSELDGGVSHLAVTSDAGLVLPV